MSFQSSKGTYNEDTRNIDLYDNTYVVLENDITVTADHVTYFSDNKTIIAIAKYITILFTLKSIEYKNS